MKKKKSNFSAPIYQKMFTMGSLSLSFSKIKASLLLNHLFLYVVTTVLNRKHMSVRS